MLDTVTTPELEAEGLARDLVRAIQDARKAAGLDVSDRIRLAVSCAGAQDAAALTANGAMIANETLATTWSFDNGPGLADEILDPASTGGHRTSIDAGRYANSGSIVIDLWRVNKTGALDD